MSGTNVKEERKQCEYCGIITFFTEDHVVPRSKGGSRRAWNNKVVACRPCNLAKGDLDLEDFKRTKYWQVRCASRRFWGLVI